VRFAIAVRLDTEAAVAVTCHIKSLVNRNEE